MERKDKELWEKVSGMDEDSAKLALYYILTIQKKNNVPAWLTPVLLAGLAAASIFSYVI